MNDNKCPYINTCTNRTTEMNELDPNCKRREYWTDCMIYKGKIISNEEKDSKRSIIST